MLLQMVVNGIVFKRKFIFCTKIHLTLETGHGVGVRWGCGSSGVGERLAGKGQGNGQGSCDQVSVG